MYAMLARMNIFSGEKTVPFFERFNLRKVVYYATTCLGVGMACWFFARERNEIHDLGFQLGHASRLWLIAGGAFTAVYISCRG